jgi:hypothetical protein
MLDLVLVQKEPEIQSLVSNFQMFFKVANSFLYVKQIKQHYWPPVCDLWLKLPRHCGLGVLKEEITFHTS